ncbi:Cell growth-regulating nucleolar protein [Pseudolycoriella hygida]|uniref:Cell growth-regulating nucleolar protein n=1 Tax=Pseudolycoriella hygida TaxID=35572 RepID=A0A9Q0N748_9DIPT|nr:Cell growth-regulating nucleolar protein [Pseudolycoriella hygida]
MVFFTCNHCGESLKKPSVEKHYQWKGCKGAVPFLTCVDCLNDFKGDAFKEHTKCITEEEKYSAKGFVAKPTKNKGAQKQETWTETLQKLINKPDIDPQIKIIIEKISAQTNVPRKKPKFINFVKNSMRISMDNANKVWDVVEEALDEFKQISEANRKKKQEENNAKNGESKVNKKNPENDKKSKEEKKKLQNGVAAESTQNEAQMANPQNVQKSKKKQKKSEKGTADESIESGVQTANPESGQKSKKKNKKSEKGTAGESIKSHEQTPNPVSGQKSEKKKKAIFAESAAPVEKTPIPENGQTAKKKKKKNGPKMQVDEKPDTNEEYGQTQKRKMDTSVDEGGAKKKKKKVSHGTDEFEVVDEPANEASNGNDSTFIGDGKFDWQSEIVSILSKKTAPMAIKKLKGKVVKKYATLTSNEVSSNVEKKFLKKLKAMKNVAITNELVKLVK